MLAVEIKKLALNGNISGDLGCSERFDALDPNVARTIDEWPLAVDQKLNVF